MNTVLDTFFSCLELLQKDFYPDIFFLDRKSGRSLTIIPNISTARYLRFRIPGGNSLHLESIAVYSSGSESDLVNIAPDATLTVSSVLPGSELLLAKKKILNPDNMGVGIHTDNTGDDEWICLNFKGRISPQRIVVCNRPGVWAWRAWGLVVECSDDGIEWFELYDHSARLEHFVASARALVCCSPVKRSQQDIQLFLLCIDILDVLVVRQYSLAEKMLEEARGLAKNDITIIRSGFDRLVLMHGHQAWSGHGILRPFSYWSESEKRSYLQQASGVVKALSEISPYVCLGFGFVLGYVRDGGLIAHDDDVDILLAFDRPDVSSFSKALEKLEECLAAAGYIVEGQHLFSHRWVRVEGGTNMDVFVGLREGSRVSWYPSARNSLCVDEVFPALGAKMHEVECLLPRNPVRYLDVTYGDNWRSSDPSFKHPWDVASYSDLNK